MDQTLDGQWTAPSLDMVALATHALAGRSIFVSSCFELGTQPPTPFMNHCMHVLWAHPYNTDEKWLHFSYHAGLPAYVQHVLMGLTAHRAKLLPAVSTEADDSDSTDDDEPMGVKVAQRAAPTLPLSTCTPKRK